MHGPIRTLRAELKKVGAHIDCDLLVVHPTLADNFHLLQQEQQQWVLRR